MNDDPIAHASTKVMSWASLAQTAAEAWAQVAAMRAQTRTARSAAEVRVARVARETRLLEARRWWQPMLDPRRYPTSSVRDAGLAWASAQAWRGYPEAEHVTRLAEDRLRALRPDVMRLYDLHRENGLDPVMAMRRVANLMDRPPARSTRTERIELTMPRSSEDVAAESFPDPPEVIIDTSGRAILLRAQKDAERFFAGSAEGSWVPGYMAGRGLGGAPADTPMGQETTAYGTPVDRLGEWGVGYAPKGWTNLVDHLKTLGYSDHEMVAAGLASETKRGTVVDRFRDRLMIPVRNGGGETVGFVGRTHPDNHSGRDPKYLNSPDTMLYHKGEQLLGLWEGRAALADGGRPVIVEGAFDAMAVSEVSEGKFVGVAPSGTALTAAQVETLKSACDVAMRGVVVAFDGDEAGKAAALRAAIVLHAASLDTPQAAVLAEGADPGGMADPTGAVDLLAALEDARPLADLVVDAKLGEWPHSLESYTDRVRAARFVAGTVTELPTVDIGRQVARLSERLDLPTGTMTGIVLDKVTDPQSPKHSFVPKEMAARQEMGLSR